jgi:hypothetical protein
MHYHGTKTKLGEFGAIPAKLLNGNIEIFGSHRKQY